MLLIYSISVIIQAIKISLNYNKGIEKIINDFNHLLSRREIIIFGNVFIVICIFLPILNTILVISGIFKLIRR